MKPVKVAIAGASGRMGQMVIEAALANPRVELVAALDLPRSISINRDAGDTLGKKTGVQVSTDVEAAVKLADCLIDFTRPEGTLAHLRAAKASQCNLVIGTTGFDEPGKAQIREAAQKIAIVFAPNMAVGVNAVFRLLEVAGQILSDGYDVEIIEAHHRHKVDAPSGTALRMGEVVAKARGIVLNEHAIYGRQGYTGERQTETIGFSTIRGGDIVGDHTALFAGLGERIEITHKSGSRMPYATGAIRAATFLSDKSCGLFDMQDVLGLR